MSTSTLTWLTPEQWRLMNVLWSRQKFTASRVASAMLHRAGAGIEDLLHLEDSGLVQVTYRLTHQDDDINLAEKLHEHGREFVGHHRLKLRVTTAGLRWLAANPGNRALWALSEDGGDQAMLLRQLTTAADVDVDLVRELYERHLVTVHDLQGLEVTPVGLTSNHRCDDYRVRLSERGSRILEP